MKKKPKNGTARPHIYILILISNIAVPNFKSKSCDTLYYCLHIVSSLFVSIIKKKPGSKNKKMMVKKSYVNAMPGQRSMFILILVF